MQLSQLIKGKQHKPRKTLLYGIEGIGKSTFMARWPNAVFISTEDGLSDIDCVRFPEAQSYSDVHSALVNLYDTSQHEFKTLVIDSIEGLEELIFRKVCDDGGKDNVEAFGYGKGYVLAVDLWHKILSALDALNQKGMHIGLIGHARVERFENPEGESYDRYTLRVHKHAVDPLTEWATEVLFCTYAVAMKSEDQGFGKSKTKAIGNGRRVIKTEARPAFRAKNRIEEMPAEMALDFSVYQNYLKEPTETKSKPKT